MNKIGQIEHRRIRGTENPLYTSYIKLYEESFPWNERRDESSLLQKISSNECFVCNALLINDNFVGLFSYWDLDGFYYVEHFAILPSMRGKQIGTDVMSDFLNHFNPVVLEVEHPDNELAKRRISFYKHLGFCLLSPNYIQPSYHIGQPDLPLFLLGTNANFDLKQNVRKLYKIVYDRLE